MTSAALDFSNPADWSPVAHCAVCDGTNFFEVRKAPDVHYGVAGLFPIFRCRDCGLQFLNPQPTPKYLETAYPKIYYSYSLRPYPQGWRLAVRKLKRLLRHVLVYHAFITRDPHFQQPGTMLDIGSGAGDFLVEMRAKGWKVRGVEVSRDAAAEGQTRGGLDIFAGTLPEANLPSEEFDYVRSNHSFEHIDNPRDVLREIRRIIKPDGCLFIGVPNVDSWAADLFGANWYNLGPPTHPFGYSPRTLTTFLEQEGFRVEHVGYNSTYAGLIGSVQIMLNRKSGKPSHVGRLINNPALMLVGQWAAQIADAFRMGDCIEIIARPVSKPPSAT